MAVPTDSDLARESVLDWSALGGWPLCSLREGHPHRAELSLALARAEIAPDVRVEGQFFAGMLHFVAAGQGLMVVDLLTRAHEAAARSTGGGVTFVDLAHPILYRYAIYTPRHRPPSLLARRVVPAWREEVRALLGTLEQADGRGGG